MNLELWPQEAKPQTEEGTLMGHTLSVLILQTVMDSEAWLALLPDC